MSRRVRVKATRASAALRSITAIKVTIKHARPPGRWEAWPRRSQQAFLRRRLGTAATLFARRRPAARQEFGSQSFKISPGHSSFPLRLKGSVSEPWHGPSVSCSPARPVLPPPAIAHTHSLEILLDDSKACGAHSIGGLSLTQGEKRVSGNHPVVHTVTIF